MKTISDRVARSRAARGAQLLDQKGPRRWFDKVSLFSLDIRLTDRCVLHDVYGHFATGLQALDMQMGVVPARYGFVLVDDDFSFDNYLRLNRAWDAEIKMRRAA